MKTTITIVTALIFSLTISVNAQSKATKNEVKTVTKEATPNRAANPKIKAETEKEIVEKNIATLVEEIKKEEKNLTEIQAQKNNPTSNKSNVDEAITNSNNKINEMTKKLAEEYSKLKELQKTIDSKE